MWPLATALVFLGVALASLALADPRSPLYLLDEPNHRSLHARPTPRGGGLAIVAVLLAALALVVLAGRVSGALTLLGATALAVAVVSFVDDCRGVAARWRLLVQVLAAGALLAAGPSLAGLALPGARLEVPAWLLAPLVLLALVWMTNLYNFMDGMDGFAAGMGVFGFATLALLAARGGAPELALAALLVAAACGGFLVANFPPARIFMGDVGASTLGFVAGGLILLADASGAFPWYLGALAFAPFVADASVTLARRALARERVWEAHRSHFYQRLVTLGWSHRRTVLAEYVAMLLACACALAAQGAPAPWQWILVSLVALAYTTGMLSVTQLERSRESG